MAGMLDIPPTLTHSCGLAATSTLPHENDILNVTSTVRGNMSARGIPKSEGEGAGGAHSSSGVFRSLSDS